MLERKNNKLVLTSGTPSKRFFPSLNRKARRSLVYPKRYSRLYRKVNELEKLLEDVELPKRRNRKYLTGYYSQLIELAKDSLKETEDA